MKITLVESTVGRDEHFYVMRGDTLLGHVRRPRKGRGLWAAVVPGDLDLVPDCLGEFTERSAAVAAVARAAR